MKRSILMAVIFSFLFAACAAAGSLPEKTVEKYFEAISQKDATALSTITCKDWESDALMILDSFTAVSTTLESLSCQQVGTDSNEDAIVACTGKIIASYNGELQEFDLSVQEYIVENSSGEWLVCGTN